jgi:flagellar basal-body rod modification protein FlgD
MTTIAPTTAPVAPSLSAATSANAGIGADFNMFLKLLTTQMQNQDPLSPMDSTQYTQQLVQYSQVEQSVKQNTSLTGILASLSQQNIAQVNGFIGRDAVFATEVSGLGQKPASWSYAADRVATTGTASITDANGKVVDTRAITFQGTKGDYSWDGTLANGSKAPDGAYSLSIAAIDAAGKTVPVSVQSTGRVAEVNISNGTVSLGVNGVSMALDKLVRLTAENA